MRHVDELAPSCAGFVEPTDWSQSLIGELPEPDPDAVRRRAASEVLYTAEEHALWALLWRALRPLHAIAACAPLRAAAALVPLPQHRIPQLHEVTGWLEPLTRFQLQPVGGLVPARRFFAALGAGVFLSTQYIRDPAHPYYTPEPDIIHELFGHAAALAHPEIAALNRLFGGAARSADAATLVELERLYWYTLEFGLLREDGAVKALGAGLLSSVKELEGICGRGPAPILRPWDPATIAATPYQTDRPQRVLFVAPSFSQLVERTSDWLRAIAARPAGREPAGEPPAANPIAEAGQLFAGSQRCEK